MSPLGLGFDAPTLIAMFPAVGRMFLLVDVCDDVGGHFFRSNRTTRIGNYVLNRSFMLRGMVATVSSISIGFLLAKLVF